MSLSKSQRAAVFAMFGGRCAYCGSDLPERGWHADHIEPVLREWWKRRPKEIWTMVDGVPTLTIEKQVMGMEWPERDVIENFFPSCAPCNLDKHAMLLETWRRVIAQKVRVLRDNHSAFRHAERFGLVVANEQPIVFYFERIPTPSSEPLSAPQAEQEMK